jgi:hypothetical protein
LVQPAVGGAARLETTVPLSNVSIPGRKLVASLKRPPPSVAVFPLITTLVRVRVPLVACQLLLFMVFGLQRLWRCNPKTIKLRC